MGSSSTIRIGYAQFAPLLGQADLTRHILQRLIQGIGKVDLLVLPELCNSGYAFADREQALKTAEDVSDSPFISFLHSWCKERSAYIVSGINERSGQELFNSAVLVGPDGLVGVYRKLHLFGREKAYFSPGNLGLPVFDLGFAKIGLLVCFDWFFPEAWRSLALDGAEIVAHPSNLVLPGLAQQATPTHGLINRIFVVTANRIGSEDDLSFTGLSTIADPTGKVIAQASADQEQVQIVDIDLELARNKNITPVNNLFTDRRPEQYGRLLEKYVADTKV